MSDKERILFYLDHLSDYQVASGYSDVRGWDVIVADDRRIGNVEHLLVNKNTERVVYLDVKADDELVSITHDPYQVPAGEGAHEFLNEKGEDHIIIPIGMVDLDEDNEKVTSSKIDYDTFARAKRFRQVSDIDFEHEVKLLRHYTGDESIGGETVGEEFYDRPEFADYLREKKK